MSWGLRVLHQLRLHVSFIKFPIDENQKIEWIIMTIYNIQLMVRDVFRLMLYKTVILKLSFRYAVGHNYRYLRNFRIHVQKTVYLKWNISSNFLLSFLLFCFGFISIYVDVFYLSSTHFSYWIKIWYHNFYRKFPNKFSQEILSIIKHMSDTYNPFFLLWSVFSSDTVTETRFFSWRPPDIREKYGSFLALHNKLQVHLNSPILASMCIESVTGI